MYNLPNAKTNYCSYLERNIMLVRKNNTDDCHNRWDCVNKSECDYENCGCRNRLIGNINNFEYALSVPNRLNVEK